MGDNFTVLTMVNVHDKKVITCTYSGTLRNFIFTIYVSYFFRSNRLWQGPGYLNLIYIPWDHLYSRKNKSCYG